MCTHDCIYLDVYTWIRTHVCIDLDVYTWVYWHGYVNMYVLTLLCCVMYASTRAVHRWILQCDTSKRIAICIAIFSLISPLTWFTLVSFFLCRKTLMKKIHLMLNMSDTTYSYFALLEIWKLCLSVWNGHRNVSAILYNIFNLEPEPKFLAYLSIHRYWKNLSQYVIFYECIPLY